MKIEAFGREVSNEELKYLSAILVFCFLALSPIGAATTVDAVEQRSSANCTNPDSEACTTDATATQANDVQQEILPLQNSSPAESASGSSVDMSRFRPVNSSEFEQFVAQLAVGSVVEVVLDQGLWGEEVVRAIKSETGNVLKILGENEGCDRSTLDKLLADRVLVRKVVAVGNTLEVCQ